MDWSELTADQEGQLAKDWRPEGTEGTASQAYLALRGGEVAKALKAVEDLSGHPLAPYLRKRSEALAAAGGTGPGSSTAGSQAEWVEIFNGKDLSGWTKDGNISVEDGVLVAKGVSGVFRAAEWSEFNLECEIKGQTNSPSVGVLGFGLAHPGLDKPYAKVVNILFLGNGRARVFVTGRTLWKSEPGVFPLGEWLPVRFEFTRRFLKIYKAGDLVGTVDLKEVSTEKGGLRFYSYMFGSVAWLRNLRIQLLSE